MYIIRMSPTVFRVWNLRIVVYPKDHKPAHVHVIGPEAEAKFDILTLECTESRGFSEKSLRKIKSYLESRKKRLMEVWYEIEE